MDFEQRFVVCLFVCVLVHLLKMDTPLLQFRMTNLNLIPVFSRSVVLRISHRSARLSERVRLVIMTESKRETKSKIERDRDSANELG